MQDGLFSLHEEECARGACLSSWRNVVLETFTEVRTTTEAVFSVMAGVYNRLPVEGFCHRDGITASKI